MDLNYIMNNSDHDLNHILTNAHMGLNDGNDDGVYLMGNINSLYYDVDELSAQSNELLKYNINVIHLNIRSLPSNFDKLRLVLSKFETHNIVFYFILLCETFLNDNNYNMFDILILWLMGVLCEK